MTSSRALTLALASPLLGVLAVACGGGLEAPATAGSVRVVSVTPIEPLEAAGSDGTDVDPAPSTRDALERAIAWAVEAARLHRGGGETEAVRRTLADARIALLEADLPEALQERGLEVLQPALPEDLRDLQLERLWAELEAEAAGDQLPERDYIERQARQILARFGATVPPPAELATFVSEVERYVDYFRGKQRAFFERAFRRKHKYWPMIERAFAARKIPIELAYVALVESGFSPRARSHADARGLWQFVPGTGRLYGLTRTEDLYDVARATEAAAEHLRDLIGVFGSDGFLLAAAAYNAGEGRVRRCLRKLDDPFAERSFWAIRDCLARETREYVPRILATAIIATDPARFGFDLPSAAQIGERYDVVVVPEPTPLATLAAAAGTTAEVLRAANDELGAARATPVRNFPLYVPRGGGEDLRASLAAGTAAAPPALPATASRELRDLRYRVRAGDTLSEIAERFGVGYRQLAERNGLRPPYRLRVGQTLDIGGAGAIRYTVRRGNTLASIAALFGVTVADLRSWNDLASARIHAGQDLLVHPPRPLRTTRYRVRRGDSVARIAARHGIAADSVLTANGLGSGSLIHPGQELLLYLPERTRTTGR